MEPRSVGAEHLVGDMAWGMGAWQLNDINNYPCSHYSDSPVRRNSAIIQVSLYQDSGEVTVKYSRYFRSVADQGLLTVFRADSGHSLHLVKNTEKKKSSGVFGWWCTWPFPITSMTKMTECYFDWHSKNEQWRGDKNQDILTFRATTYFSRDIS